jgi:hypothetical protein
MATLHVSPTHGIKVFDADGSPVGQVQDTMNGMVLIHLDLDVAFPADVVHEIDENQIVLDSREADWAPLVLSVDEVRPQGTRGVVCCACRASSATKKDVPYLRRRDAWFCAECWQELQPAGVARLVQEVSLRGVPFN